MKEEERKKRGRREGVGGRTQGKEGREGCKERGMKASLWLILVFVNTHSNSL